jgi:hypothetical protein
MRGIVLAALLAGCVAQMAKAEDGKAHTFTSDIVPTGKTFSTIGYGTKNCIKWLESKNDETSRLVFETWILGFISGINVSSRNYDIDLPGNEPRERLDYVRAFMDDYCLNHPTNDIQDGALKLAEKNAWAANTFLFETKK